MEQAQAVRRGLHFNPHTRRARHVIVITCGALPATVAYQVSRDVPKRMCVYYVCLRHTYKLRIYTYAI
jgi:hypothetical protein